MAQPECPRIAARFAPIRFGLILSGKMSLMVSGISTGLATGLDAGFAWRLLVGAWLPSWLLAFPAVLVMTPITRRMVAALTRA